jgi:aspartate kinase
MSIAVITSWECLAINMAVVVQKFGGTSVGSIERIRSVAKIIKSEIDNGNQVVAVISAMAGTTQSLINLAKNFSCFDCETSKQEYDSIIATGETVSSSLVALALTELGVKSRSWQGWQLPIYTNDNHADGRILEVDTKELLSCLKKDEVPVITGFQGVYNDRIVTLGRGGSDTSAVAIAVSLNADRCDIYTDVDGIYTADPSKVSTAKKINIITYEEMLELSSHGAKVLHPRSVEIALKNKLKLRVLSSLDPDSTGTTFTLLEPIEGSRVTAIAANDKLTFFELTNFKDIKQIFAILQTCELLSLSQTQAIICVSSEYKEVIAKELAQHCTITEYEGYAEVSVVGVAIKSDKSIMATVLKLASENDIEIKFCQLSDLRISLLIKQESLTKLVKLLHDTLI